MGLLDRLLGRTPQLPPPTYSNAAVIARIEKEHRVDAWHAFLLHSRDYEAYCTSASGA